MEWFYVIEGERQGPVADRVLKRLYEDGKIDEATLVWKASFKEWKPLLETELLREPEVVEPEVQATKSLELPRAGEEPRPWVRFWARMTDYHILAGIGLFFFYFFLPEYFTDFQKYFSLLVVVTWMPIEAVLLSSWGWTPGKWLLRVKVRDKNGEKLNFADSTQRIVQIFIWGMACGFPFLNIIAYIYAYYRLSTKNQTYWDEGPQIRVQHKTVGVIRSVLTLSLLLLVGFFASLPTEDVEGLLEDELAQQEWTVDVFSENVM